MPSALVQALAALPDATNRPTLKVVQGLAPNAADDDDEPAAALVLPTSLPSQAVQEAAAFCQLCPCLLEARRAGQAGGGTPVEGQLLPSGGAVLIRIALPSADAAGGDAAPTGTPYVLQVSSWAAARSSLGRSPLVHLETKTPRPPHAREGCAMPWSSTTTPASAPSCHPSPPASVQATLGPSKLYRTVSLDLAPPAASAASGMRWANQPASSEDPAASRAPLPDGYRAQLAATFAFSEPVRAAAGATGAAPSSNATAQVRGGRAWLARLAWARWRARITLRCRSPQSQRARGVGGKQMWWARGTRKLLSSRVQRGRAVCARLCLGRPISRCTPAGPT